MWLIGDQCLWYSVGRRAERSDQKPNPKTKPHLQMITSQNGEGKERFWRALSRIGEGVAKTGEVSLIGLIATKKERGLPDRLDIPSVAVGLAHNNLGDLMQPPVIISLWVSGSWKRSCHLKRGNEHYRGCLTLKLATNILRPHAVQIIKSERLNWQNFLIFLLIVPKFDTSLSTVGHKFLSIQEICAQTLAKVQ